MYEKHKKIYKIKPICPSMCPPKPSKPHQIRKEYYPPKPRAEGSSPSAPAKGTDSTLSAVFSFCEAKINQGEK